MRVGEMIQFQYKFFCQTAVIEEIDWENKLLQVAWYESPYKIVKVIGFNQIIK
jgi:hypothetical protein